MYFSVKSFILSLKKGDVMEENRNLGLELFSNVLDGVEDGYDMEESVQSWMDDSIFSLFDKTFEEKKEKIIDDNLKKKIMETLVEMCPGFFADKSNIIYLKLSNLYDMFLSKGEENQELYYIVDRFSPDQDELNKVNNVLDTIVKRFVNKDMFENFFQEIYANAMNEYLLANKYGKKQALENPEDDSIREASEALNNSLDLYTEDYVYAMVEQNRLKDFVGEIVGLKGVSLPVLFSLIYGSELSREEKIIISSELDEVQQDLLSSTIAGRSK